MKRYKLISLLILGLALLSSSCVKEDLKEPNREGELVDMSLTILMQQFDSSAGMTETKSVTTDDGITITYGTAPATRQTAELSNESSINDLWVVQCLDNTSFRVSYIPSVGALQQVTLNGVNYSAYKVSVPMVRVDYVYRHGVDPPQVLLIANTADPNLFAGVYAMSDLWEKMDRVVNSEAEVTANNRIVMTGNYVGSIPLDYDNPYPELTRNSLMIDMFRSVVKLEVTVNPVSTLTSGEFVGYPLTLNKVQIESASRWIPLKAGMKSATRYPAVSYRSTQNYSDYFMDYPEESLTFGNKMNWYLAPNRRGVGPNVTTQAKSRFNDPSYFELSDTYNYYSYATRIVLKGTLDGKPIKFRIYPGGSYWDPEVDETMINSYNLTPNTVYSLNITINGVSRNDQRIEYEFPMRYE